MRMCVRVKRSWDLSRHGRVRYAKRLIDGDAAGK